MCVYVNMCVHVYYVCECTCMCVSVHVCPCVCVFIVTCCLQAMQFHLGRHINVNTVCIDVAMDAVTH